MSASLRQPFLLYLALGTLLAGACVAVTAEPAHSLLYGGVGASALAALAVGLRRLRPATARCWWLLGAGVALFVLADGLFTYWNVVLERDVPFPSFHDGLYMGGYVLVVLGLIGLTPRTGGGTLVDSLIVSAAATLVVWVVLIAPSAEQQQGPLAALVAAAYPFFDLLLLVVLVQLVLGRERPPRAHALLALGLLLLFAADVSYTVLNLQSAALLRWSPLGWLLCYVLVGVAALDPTVRTSPEAARARGPARRSQRGLGLLALASAMLAAPALLIVSEVAFGHAPVLAGAVGGGVISTLALVRLVSLLRSETRLRAEAERSERWFRSLIENSSDVLTIVDRRGRVGYASPSAARVLGRPPAALVRRDVAELVHPEDAERLDALLRAVAAEPRAHRAERLRLAHADGSWRTLEVSAQNLLDEPAVAGIILSSRDVTARERLEDQLRQAQKMEAVGQLAGGIAHDFNNLLTAVQGFSDLALLRLEGEGGRREIEQVRAAGERAGSLTQQLLAFSRRQVLSPTELDLNAAIADAERLIGRLIGPHIQVRTDLRAAPGYVRADAGQLTQVLMNLAINARDAMPDGGTLTLATGRDTVEGARAEALGLAPGQYVALRVQDTGEGMDEATRARVFEPFFTTKAPGLGTGLGLATVYGIATQSGGAVSVASSPGAGTTFRVWLPACAPPAPASSPNGAVGPEHSSGRVLLVAEDAAVREVVAGMLRELGHEVTVAEHPDRALEVARTAAFDILVSDLVLPGIGGRRLARELTDRHPGLRVLLISGYADSPQGAGVGLDAPLLPKPFTAAALRAALDALGEPAHAGAGGAER